MQAQQTAAPRLLRYDAGLLFLWCWLLGLGHQIAIGHVDILLGLGSGFWYFVMASVFLFGRRHSPTRLRGAMIAATIITALLTYGNFAGSTHP